MSVASLVAARSHSWANAAARSPNSASIAPGCSVTNVRESLTKYSRLHSASDPNAATRGLHALMEASCAGARGELKNTCALRYICCCPEAFPLSQSSTSLATDAAEGAMKYTASRCGCGCRPSARFSTRLTPAPVSSLIPRAEDTTLTVTWSTTRTFHDE